MLGEMSCRIHLFHGLMLFLVFHFGFSFGDTPALSAIEHWLVLPLDEPTAQRMVC